MTRLPASPPPIDAELAGGWPDPFAGPVDDGGA
jgi:hypothetical protein